MFQSQAVAELVHERSGLLIRCPAGCRPSSQCDQQIIAADLGRSAGFKLTELSVREKGIPVGQLLGRELVFPFGFKMLC